jgi:Spy/CpxP family protein refolding chaperone
MRNLFIVFLLFIVSTIAVATANAQSEGDERRPMSPRGGRQMAGERPPQQNLRRLGLSAEQFEKIRSINRERRPSVELAQGKLRSSMQALDDAIYADAADSAEIEKRLMEVRTAQRDLLDARTSLELEIRRVLTVEQLRTFRGMRSRGPQRMASPSGQPGQRPGRRPGRMRDERAPEGRPPDGRSRPQATKPAA